MPAIRRLPDHSSLKSSFPPFLGFATSCDERGSFIDLFSNYSDVFEIPDEMQGSLSNSLPPSWTRTNAMLSELDDYESGSIRAPPAFSSPAYEEHYALPDTHLDTSSLDWSSYDASSSASGSPHLGMSSEGGYGFSPSISITNSSPRSDNGVLTPPSRDYGNVIEFTHCYSNDAHPPSSWSTRHSPRSQYSQSPSPSPHGWDLGASISRDPSPSSASSGDAKPDKRRFPCLILGCDRRFTSQYTLKVHMEAHKPKPKVTFQCTEGCQERFSRQHDRLRHEVAKHGKICEFSCGDCSRFFSTKKTLGNHKCPVALGSTRWVEDS
ncbi:hypothetical protein D9611_008904 [Ephemerocybe angulata]|uniref:C2H2-type domain-containing protein n=1 Tax=Ephemerocybe angulata TaxID=980116 RepID=A0A8H5FCI3_9AGAR|nr:hypothetical protein D9611_008904 [Tulosesus angulatus]